MTRHKPTDTDRLVWSLVFGAPLTPAQREAYAHRRAAMRLRIVGAAAALVTAGILWVLIVWGLIVLGAAIFDGTTVVPR